MWKSTVLIKIVLVFIGFILFSIGSNVAWTILGSLVLLGCCWFMFRQGQNAGHESCAVTKSIERVEAEGKRADEGLYRQAWSRSNGVKSVFAGALFAYAVNAVYIILSLLDVSEMAVMISRVASWVVTMPYWPVIAMFHETYVALTPDIVIVLMASPFLLPLCHYFGYLCGPKLWQNTEKAMIDGRRRAKARSRIVKKKAPRIQKPEI